MVKDETRLVVKSHGLASVAVVLIGVLLLSVAMHVYQVYFPPEEILIPRAPDQTVVAPGERFAWAGTYQMVREGCNSTFYTSRQWVSEEGPEQVTTGGASGSVPTHVASEPYEIRRILRVPDTALPGTTYRYNTHADWVCFPWLGILAPRTRVHFAEIRVEVE